MDLTALPAHELARRITEGEATAQDAVEAYRERAEAINPNVNAFVTQDWDAAEADAAELDGSRAPKGPLHGVPVAIKDIFPTRNLRTTYGSRSYEAHVPDHDALHVARLRAAGAVIVGKTNTPEFAFSGQTSNPVAGTTRNPLNGDLTVAGSSGGSAAALAGNMVALADGSDLGGSLRTPAAWCGIIGYRPTAGLIPLIPNPTPFDGLHVPGPMGRCVADVALMAKVMAGNDPRAPLGYWHAWPEPDSQIAGRAAISYEPFGADVHPSIQAALSGVPKILENMGWAVAGEKAPPLEPLLPFVSLVRGLSAQQVRAAKQPEMALVGESFATACASGKDLSLIDIADYHTVQAKTWSRVCAFFEQFDFALWPTTTGLPFRADLRDGEITEDWRTVTLTPMLELPCLSIPCGTGSDGMPVGLHITGPRGSDARLLAFAETLELQISLQS